MVAIGSLFNHILLAFATNGGSFDELYRSSVEIITMTDDATATNMSEDKGVIGKLRSVGMEKKEMPHHADLRRASVLVPLFDRGGGSSDNETANTIHVLLTQRPQKMKSHGGEVCFPGGKQDPEDDGDDIRTALREAHEEIGLNPRFVERIARLQTLESRYSLCVTPIIGLIDPPTAAEPSQLKLNEEEVEAAFAVPLDYFLKQDNLHSIQKAEWRGDEFMLRTYLYDCPENGRRFKIWGLTAHIVHQVAKLSFESEYSLCPETNMIIAE